MRRLFTISSVVSFLLCALLCTLWVRSLWLAEGVVKFKPGELATIDLKEIKVKQPMGHFTGVVSRQGGIAFMRIQVPDDGFKKWETWSVPLKQEGKPEAAKMTWNTVASGFSIGEAKVHYKYTDLISKQEIGWNLPAWRFSISYAPLVILTALLPYFWIARLRLMAKRERDGLCVECGHSVKGKTGKCENCGAEIPVEE